MMTREVDNKVLTFSVGISYTLFSRVFRTILNIMFLTFFVFREPFLLVLLVFQRWVGWWFSRPLGIIVFALLSPIFHIRLYFVVGA